MTVHPVSPMTQAHKNTRRLQVLGVVAALVLVAAGAVTWRITESDTAPRSSRGVAAVSQPAPLAGQQTQPSSAAAVVVAPAALRPEQPLVVYMVGSSDVQARVQAQLEEAAAVRRSLGDSNGPQSQLVLVTSSQEEAQLEQNLQDLNNQRHAIGLPDVKLVDLR